MLGLWGEGGETKYLWRMSVCKVVYIFLHALLLILHSNLPLLQVLWQGVHHQGLVTAPQADTQGKQEVRTEEGREENQPS